VLLVGLVVLLAGAGGAILLLTHHRSEETPPPADAAVVAKPVDAAVIVEPADAAPTPADAEQIVLAPADAGRTVRDAGSVGPHPATIRVTVYVRPGDALVYTNGNYRGPANTTLEEPWGRKMKIECKTTNMKGSVNVVFDGSKTNVMCTATRQRFCVDGIKNPFDDCEERP
jgi:hypothetical protein